MRMVVLRPGKLGSHAQPTTCVSVAVSNTDSTTPIGPVRYFSGAPWSVTAGMGIPAGKTGFAGSFGGPAGSGLHTSLRLLTHWLFHRLGSALQQSGISLQTRTVHRLQSQARPSPISASLWPQYVGLRTVMRGRSSTKLIQRA